jgi:ADP-ribose pyrophosphatase YjhB (NUDIX family)
MPAADTRFACAVVLRLLSLCLVQVDAGELPEAALVRELQEELSIQVGLAV